MQNKKLLMMNLLMLFNMLNEIFLLSLSIHMVRTPQSYFRSNVCYYPLGKGGHVFGSIGLSVCL